MNTISHHSFHSSSSSDDSTNSDPRPRKKMKWRKQKFNPQWLNLGEFKNWLKEDSADPFSCSCIACNCKLRCGKSELQRHCRSKKHIEKVKLVVRNTNVEDYFKPLKTSNEERKTQECELRLSTFFAEHNVALQVVDHLIPLLKQLVPDSQIIQKIELGRQKCTNVIKNVLAPYMCNELVNILKTNKFSIMLDESTDIGLNKTMCVLTRFVHPSTGHVSTKLLQLMHLNAVDCTADKLYAEFVRLMNNCEIPITNIVGMASDGASVMVGRNNSFASRLLKDNKDVIVMKCVCHIAAIIASKACMVLPRAPEDLLRQVYSYLSGSSKRCAQLEEMQDYFNVDKKKILRAASTRWLSLHKCVDRILENWEVLRDYFRVAVSEDKLKSAEIILKELENLCTKAYLLFLKYVLNYFNSLNALFQAKKPLIHELHTECRKLFLRIGQNFIKPDKLHENVNVRSPHIYVDIETMYLGRECSAVLNSITDQEAVTTIKKDCLNFYITALEEIQNRLPIKKDDNFFKSFVFLKPEIALDVNRNKVDIDFKLLCEKLNMNSSVDVLIEEWRILVSLLDENIRSDLSNKSVDEFWWEISKMKSFEDYLFPNLSKLANTVLSLPHANADCERIFSIVSDVRTKKRNKLGHEALNAICLIRSHFQDCGTDCTKYKWKDDIYENMKANKLYNHKKL